MIRALLVDDEEPARSELRYLLARHPEVDVAGEAAGATEALELTRATHPDVVFLDVELPGLTGVEVAALLGEAGEPPAIVFVTAQRDVETFDRAKRAGGDDFITKPFRPDELVVRVQTALRLRQMGNLGARVTGRLPAGNPLRQAVEE